MSTAAQVLANQANAQLSSGPKTAEGKAKASKNSTTHGLATGFLHIAETDREAFHQFEANLKEAARPQGALERETCNQLLHAAWRLRRVQSLLQKLYRDHRADPLVTPAAVAQLRQLNRYRATLEMTFYRSLKQLRDLQTRRAGRDLQLHPPERLYCPSQLNPNIYAAARFSRADREMLLENCGLMGNWITCRIVLDRNFLPQDTMELVPRKSHAPRR
ncbi:MAG: hypothetical protein ACKV2U_15120 [Bryobacteraceae bacterium]